MSGELTRIKVRDMVATLDRTRLTRKPRNTRRPTPKGECI